MQWFYPFELIVIVFPGIEKSCNYCYAFLMLRLITLYSRLKHFKMAFLYLYNL